MIIKIVASCVNHQRAAAYIIERVDTRCEHEIAHLAIHVRVHWRQVTAMPIAIRSGMLVRVLWVPMPTRYASWHHITVDYRRLTRCAFMHMETVCASDQFFHLRLKQQAIRTFTDQDGSHLLANTVGIDFIHRHGQLSRGSFACNQCACCEHEDHD
ncbi:hypothetical protein WK09_11710 [Burkholderia ubonensis]|nr:hypothetical protein WK09_11710 [Burkholderia ubonensis]